MNYQDKKMTINKKNSNNFILCSNIYEFTLKK